MKTLKTFINESAKESVELQYIQQLVPAIRHFSSKMTYDTKIGWDFSKNQYLAHYNLIVDLNESWYDAKIAKMLKSNNIGFGRLMVYLSQKFALNDIPKATPNLSVYYKNSNAIELFSAEVKGQNIKKLFDDAKKQFKLDKTNLHIALDTWSPTTSSNVKDKPSHIGIGSSASIKIVNNYSNVYSFVNLLELTNITKDEFKDIISKHWKFKRDKIDFDFNQSLLFVNGSFTDTWD